MRKMLEPCPLILAAFLLVCVAMPAPAQSTHSFNSGMNCYSVWRLPDTGQSTSYTATFGEDHDYLPAASQMSYTVNADNTITDNVTGLMWRRCSQGKNDDATCTGAAGTYTWENALAQCEAETADHSDWRLPNVQELLSIMHFDTSPCINATAFPGTLANLYWTSTTNTLSATYAFFVIYSNCGTDVIPKTNSYYVRCVRGGT